MLLPERVKVAILGGGQAGLSVAYYLRKYGLEPGVDFVVIDQGPSTGGAWQFRWESLRFDEAHRVNDLPGMRELGLSFADAAGDVPARDVVAQYYQQFEHAYDLRVARPLRVEAVRRIRRGFDVVAVPLEADPNAGTSAVGAVVLRADVIVNAAGTWGQPFVPFVPGAASFRGIQRSTPDYHSSSDFAGRSVVVVGGGTSAIGFIIELQGVAERVIWATRRPVQFIDAPMLTTELGVEAVAEQDAAARAGAPLPSIVSTTGVPLSERLRPWVERGVLRSRPMFDRIEPDGVAWDDGSFEAVDAIIWATGFRPDLRHLAPLHLREPEGGIAVVDGRSVREPRLFMAGYGPQASTIGASRAGRAIGRQVLLALT